MSPEQTSLAGLHLCKQKFLESHWAGKTWGPCLEAGIEQHGMGNGGKKVNITYHSIYHHKALSIEGAKV